MKFSPNSNALKLYKSQLGSLTQIQFETAIGLILGDVSIQSQNKGKTHRLKFEWGDINKEYAFHVYSIYKEWILTEPKKRSRININQNEVNTWWFQTISHEAFNPLAELFLKNNKKSIPTNLIRDHLTPRGLTYWFMDDGGKLDYSSNEGKGIVFNTHSFTEEEVLQMCIELKEKFSLDCKVKFNKNKPIIGISGKNYEVFNQLINPYILSSMKRKLPTPRKSFQMESLMIPLEENKLDKNNSPRKSTNVKNNKFNLN